VGGHHGSGSLSGHGGGLGGTLRLARLGALAALAALLTPLALPMLATLLSGLAL
jgi:hypothetical protein